MSQWERYQARERRRARLQAVGAWTLLILAAVGMVALIWVVTVFVFGSVPA